MKKKVFWFRPIRIDVSLSAKWRRIHIERVGIAARRAIDRVFSCISNFLLFNTYNETNDQNAFVQHHSVLQSGVVFANSMLNAIPAPNDDNNRAAP